jgi:DNA-directed RNA polymerase specialized sigma24 family protein
MTDRERYLGTRLRETTDEAELAAIRSELTDLHLGMIYRAAHEAAKWITKHYAHYTGEELIGTAYQAFDRALRYWRNSDHDVRWFGRNLWIVTRHQTIQLWDIDVGYPHKRVKRKEPHEVRIAPHVDAHGEAKWFADDLEDGENAIAGIDDLDAFEAIISPLKERDQKLLRLIYIDGYSLTRASKVLGLKSDGYISTLHKRILAQLRERLEGRKK